MTTSAPAQIARQWLAQNPIFLAVQFTHTDSTGEVCELALVDKFAHTLLDTLIRPTVAIHPDAAAVHPITNSMVQAAPSFADVWPRLKALIRNRLVILYGANITNRLFIQSARANRISLVLERTRFFCAMKLYAQFYGRWNHHTNTFKNQALDSALYQQKITIPADWPIGCAISNARAMRLLLNQIAATGRPQLTQRASHQLAQSRRP